MIRKVYRKGLITKEIYEAQRRARDKLSSTAHLLPKTVVHNFAEMRSQVLS
jgi:hypothetical protein